MMLGMHGTIVRGCCPAFSVLRPYAVADLLQEQILESVAGSYNERGGELQLDLPSIKKAGTAKEPGVR